MTNLILDNIYLILLLPLWIFLIIMGGRFFSVYVNKKIIYTLTLLSSFLGMLLCSVSILKMDSPVVQNFSFIKINNFAITAGLHIDKLSLIMAFVLFLVSFLVQIFSVKYMKDEPKNYRFYAYLNMFNFSMAGLLFSPNMFQMYIFWELVGVISYLLIGFEYKNKEKSEASRRVFLMNRVGDTALIAGIIIVSYFMYNYAGNLSFAELAFEDMNVISTLFYAYTSTPYFWIVCVLFIIAAAVKSAQFPFYTWLQDAMEAKLPVSALLHSATMVALGVYLIIRLVPFFVMEKYILTLIMIIGIITALLCSILASIETHPKKVLAYSTSANLGLMFWAAGMGNIKACIILFIAHALIKSMLFLCLAIKDSFAGYITFLLGGLSLAGLIFSGMVAKEIMFAKMAGALEIIFCITALLTAFYIIRISLVMLKDEKLKNKIDFAEFIPIAFLFLANIIFYFVIRKHAEYKIAEPFWCALVGWAVVYFLYTKNLLTKFNKTPCLLEKFYNNTLVWIYDFISKISDFIDVKILSNYKPVKWICRAFVKTAGFVEDKIMNGAVRLTVSALKGISRWDSCMQSGNVQTYNAYAFIVVTIVISSVIVIYTLVMSQFS